MFHASLWSGTAASWVDLHPTWAGATYSFARDTSGAQQTGYAVFGSTPRASLWSGTAASWVNLDPASSAESAAFGIAGTQQVGYAKIQGVDHAGLWNGTPTSWVDLHPEGVGATSSVAWRTIGTQQVGLVEIAGIDRASVWDGSAASWLDLSNYLPESWETNAQSIWSDGATTLVAGWGRALPNGVPQALLWTKTVTTCDADCDGSGQLTIDDFICFQTLYATGDPEADCDQSGGLDIDDFICFQTLFAVGC